uniref:Serine/threonine-protein kinase n=1 Tax=Schistosoma mansoni TaxID=6183 RepID=A0A5K4F372_SCHMA
MNNFIEGAPSKFVNKNDISTHISPNLTLLRKSKTLMSNGDTSAFVEKWQNKNATNRQDKGARRLALFIEHFKRRAKSADPSNKAVFYNGIQSRNNLVPNTNILNSNQLYTENLSHFNTNMYRINQKTNSQNHLVQVTSTTVPTNNSYLSSRMSNSAYETTNLINSQYIGSQIYNRPRPASFHPSSQLVTRHNPYFCHNNSTSYSNEENCNQISPYTYGQTDNSFYVEPSQQNKINNVITYDSIYDYPPNLSPYPCPTFIPYEDITPTNENVNSFLSSTQSRIRPTSVDFYRLRKMHKGMKQLFSFNGRKENINEQSFCNTKQLEENQAKRSSFTENKQLASPVTSINDKTDHTSLNDSSNRNFKRTILRSFSCNPRSNCDHRRKVKPQTIKSQNVTGNTADNYGKWIELNKNLSLSKNDAKSRLHVVSYSETEPVNYITISGVQDRKPLQINSKFSMVKSSSICQVSTCHNIPKLSTQVIQSENTKLMELRNCKCINSITRTTRVSINNASDTMTTITTSPILTNINTLSSSFTSPLPTTTATTYVECMLNDIKHNLRYTNNDSLQSSSSFNTPVNHNKKVYYSNKIHENQTNTYTLLSKYKSNQNFDDIKWNNSQNNNCNPSNHHNIGNDSQTKHKIFLSDYLSSTETSSFDKHATANNNTRFTFCSILPLNFDNSRKPNNFMSSSLFEPKVNGTGDCSMLSRSDTCSNLKEFPKRPSIEVGHTEEHNKRTSMSKEYLNNSVFNHNLTRTKLLSNLQEFHCSRLSQLYNSIGYENLKNDRFLKKDDNSRDPFPNLRNFCQKQTTSNHPISESTVSSAAVLRPPRPPQRTTSLARDHQPSRTNEINSTDTSCSSRSSPSRNVNSSTQDPNSQVYSTTICGLSNPNRYSHCKPLDNNMNNHLPDKLIDKEVSDLNSPENDTVWWSHLLPYKPSNLPSNLADRLRQRNSLILSRSSPTTRLSNSSLPNSFPFNNNNKSNNNSNLQNIMIQSMYEHSDSGDYTGLQSDVTSLYCVQNKHVNDIRLRQSRPISMHTDYSQYNNNNNSFFLPSLTHFNTTINSNTVTHSSPLASSSSSISSLQQQQQQTPKRPSSLSLASSFTNVIPKLDNLIKTNKLRETLNSSKSISSSLSSSTSTSTTSATITTNNSQLLFQNNVCNIIPDYLLKSCPPSDSPLLGQYCRLLLLRANDDHDDTVATVDHINIVDTEDNNNISTLIDYSVKLTPTAETPATPV